MGFDQWLMEILSKISRLLTDNWYSIFLVYIIWFIVVLKKTERKWSRRLFFYVNLVIILFASFMANIIIHGGTIEQLVGILSSLIVAVTTICLIWVELSKRPEFKLKDFVPVICEYIGMEPLIHRADHKKGIKQISRLWGIKEAEIEGKSFQGKLTFTTDLSNIGYTEVIAHEYYYYIDGKEKGPEVLGTLTDRWKMESQRRRSIDLPILEINDNNLHKLKLTVHAMTEKCSKEVWFRILEDYKKIRYVQVNSFTRTPFLSWIVKYYMDC